MSNDRRIQELIGQLFIMSEYKNELYNTLIPIILSKKFLKNSNEKRNFVEKVLGFQIAKYAYSSKTILIGKIIGIINEMDVAQAVELSKKLHIFLLEVANVKAMDENNTEQKKEKQNIKQKESFFSQWDSYIKSTKKQ